MGIHPGSVARGILAFSREGRSHFVKIAYFDCFSGISGDMLVGAFLDAGLPFTDLQKALGSLTLHGYTLETVRTQKNQLYGTRLIVSVEAQKQGHRRFRDIKDIIQSSGLTRWVKQKSLETFERIAVEESRIHSCPVEEVEFHEVGAADSIIDIVGTLYGVECLGIASVCASALPLGSGFADTRHGRIPLPAPATLGLLKGIPVYDSGIKQELVTPTGAALVRTLAKSFGPMPPMVVEKIGYGAGSRDLPDRPNLLRVIIGEEELEERLETVTVLEANLDDTNPEWLSFLMDRLFEAGALDVIFCPVQMKKNRPGVLVHVIGKPHQQNDLIRVLFRESTTIGVRFRYSQRRVLERSSAELESPWGPMRVKRVVQPDGSSFIYPEYEVCRKTALDKGVPLKEVYSWVMGQNRRGAT
jgi:uncharacterized protein (TIGR00299 family) protein